MIAGVKTKDLKVIPDERGHLQEIMRNDDEVFTEFGQAYATTTFQGVVKGWHYHDEQSDNVVCIRGMIKLVLFDDRKGSKTKGKINEFFIGDQGPKLVHIPKGVYHGWKCVSEETAYIINLPDKVYNYKKPDEHRVDPHKNDIPYDWATKDG
ncbi:dTDP-4-dehydrorhamnose 3,5-epimerase family protein [Candidatus Margulisiibacteriota bacterium]